MPNPFLSLSTDQVAAFIELARQGSLRQAAVVLHITEQGVRNRLLVLESRLGAKLYHKVRGPRRASLSRSMGIVSCRMRWRSWSGPGSYVTFSPRTASPARSTWPPRSTSSCMC